MVYRYSLVVIITTWIINKIVGHSYTVFMSVKWIFKLIETVNKTQMRMGPLKHRITVFGNVLLFSIKLNIILIFSMSKETVKLKSDIKVKTFWLGFFNICF